MVNIHAEALHALMQLHADLIFLDVRFACENEEEPFPLPARNITWHGASPAQAAGFMHALQTIAKPDQPILLFCRSGRRSAEAARFLETQGFRTIYNLAGGCMDFAPRLIVDRYPRSPSDMQLFCV